VNKIYIIIILLVFCNGCERFTQEDRFNKIVYDEYHWQYHGIIVEKYIDKNDHNRHIIILENNDGRDRRDYTFQSLRLFDFLAVGDSIVKERKSINLNIRRGKLDTIIQLDFGNLKGSEIYSLENSYLKSSNK
jgi:hypothetical protein